MQQPPPPQGKSVGQGIVEGAGAIGSALFNRPKSPVAPKPNIAPPPFAPVDIPANLAPQMPMPEYGTPPVAQNDNPLLRKKPDILSLLGGGGYGSEMA